LVRARTEPTVRPSARRPAGPLSAPHAVAGLVLAAGLASRFGGAKLAAPLEGRPLISHVLDTVGTAVERGLLLAGFVVAAVGRDAPADAVLVRLLAEERGLAVVGNDDPAAGLSRSLRLGLQALESLPVGAAIVLLGDQPRTDVEVIATLIAEWRHRRAPILVPRYRAAGGAPGNPVVVGRDAWPLARHLRGDSGMSAVARRRPDLIAYLEVEGVNPDVDRPADLDALSDPSR